MFITWITYVKIPLNPFIHASSLITRVIRVIGLSKQTSDATRCAMCDVRCYNGGDRAAGCDVTFLDKDDKYGPELAKFKVGWVCTSLNSVDLRL